MTEQSSIDLTILQLAIIHTAAERQNYTYKEIADECDCSTSTVGRTLRNNQLPDRNRPAVEATSSLDTHERLRWHATMDALARVGKFLLNAEQRQTTAQKMRTEVKYKQEQVKEAVVDTLATELTQTHSVEMIRDIIKKRLTFYPTRELYQDILDIARGEVVRPSANELEPLCVVLRELEKRCTAIKNIEIISPATKRQYVDARDCYRRFANDIRKEIKKYKHIIVDPHPPEVIVDRIEEARRKRVLKTAQVIHDGLEAGKSVGTIIDQYPMRSPQISPSELINTVSLDVPLYPRPAVDLDQIRAELAAAPSFAH